MLARIEGGGGRKTAIAVRGGDQTPTVQPTRPAESPWWPSAGGTPSLGPTTYIAKGSNTKR